MCRFGRLSGRSFGKASAGLASYRHPGSPSREIDASLAPDILINGGTGDPGRARHRIQFLDKPNGANGNGAEGAADTAANGGTLPAGGAPAQVDDPDADDTPF